MKAVGLLASIIAALALVAAGCGGGDDDESSGTSETVEWADSFCTAVTGWTDALQEVGNQFTDLSNLNEDSIDEGANQLREATDDLVNEIKALGRPDTESGDAVEQAVDDLASEVEGGLDEIEETVEGISGLQDLPSAISSLTSTFSAMSQALSSAVTTLEDADAGTELRDAFEEAPACDELTSPTS